LGSLRRYHDPRTSILLGRRPNMHTSVEFHAEEIGFDVPDERVVGKWRGPEGLRPTEIALAVERAIERPLEFPALRQAVVPGAQVVIGWDASRGHDAATTVLCHILVQGGVDAESIHILTVEQPENGWNDGLPPGITWSVHDPTDATQLAYLANTPQGRRI